jgi:GNAT superfamily N-acetyltransferase
MEKGMDRVKRVLLQHGLSGCLMYAMRYLTRYLVTVLYQHERHIWYVATPSAIKSGKLLSKELKLQRAGPEHLDMLAQSNLCGRSSAARYLAAGADLWMVRETERAAFCCWIFRTRTPTVAARGGWKTLPPDTVCLEASITSSDYRGRGIASVAWASIAEGLQQEGVRTIITKVEIGNIASRRAVLKVGFHEAALMDFLQIAGVSRVRVVSLGEVREQDRDVLTDLHTLAA